MIIVAGTIRIPEDKIEALLPTARGHARSPRARRRAASSTPTPSTCEDRGLVRIYEEWESLRAICEAHLKQPHMGPWRAKLAEIGASGPQHQALRGGSRRAALIQRR